MYFCSKIIQSAGPDFYYQDMSYYFYKVESSLFLQCSKCKKNLLLVQIFSKTCTTTLWNRLPYRCFFEHFQRQESVIIYSPYPHNLYLLPHSFPIIFYTSVTITTQTVTLQLQWLLYPELGEIVYKKFEMQFYNKIIYSAFLYQNNFQCDSIVKLFSGNFYVTFDLRERESAQNL